MVFDARTPRYLWLEAINTANYLTNRSPTRANLGVSPYQRLSVTLLISSICTSMAAWLLSTYPRKSGSSSILIVSRAYSWATTTRQKITVSTTRSPAQSPSAVMSSLPNTVSGIPLKIPQQPLLSLWKLCPTTLRSSKSWTQCLSPHWPLSPNLLHSLIHQLLPSPFPQTLRPLTHHSGFLLPTPSGLFN
jgi:hypothetical protein